MGLNMNYKLLAEGANSKFRIPEYRYMGSSHDIYSEGYILEHLVTFNQIMRESRVEIAEISNRSRAILEDTENIDCGVATEVVNGITGTIEKVINAVKNIKDILENLYEGIEKSIKEKSEDIREDKIDKRYRQADKVKLLRKAVNELPSEDTCLMIPDIKPTEDLLRKDFAATASMGTRLSRMIDNSISECAKKDRNRKDYSRISTDYSEDLMDYLEDEKEGLFDLIFGRYSYDITNPIVSAEEAAEKAFGSKERSNTKMNPDLYLLACDNLTRGEEILDIIDRDLDMIDDSYKQIINSLEKAKDSVSSICDNSNIRDGFGNDARKNFVDSSNVIVNSVERIFNAVQQIVSANFNILKYKGERIYQIFDPEESVRGGDSARVKAACNNIIFRYLNGDTKDLEEPRKNFVYTPTNDLADVAELQDELESVMIMVEEFWTDYSFSQNTIRYILEAETGDGNVKTNTTTTTTGTKKTTSPDGILDKILRTFNDLFNKFMEFIRNLFKLDKPFWDKNKETIKINLRGFDDVDVADIYDISIEEFRNKIDLMYNEEADYLSSDEAMQEAILKKINRSYSLNDERFKNEDTFVKKVMRAYYHSKTEKGSYKKVRELTTPSAKFYVWLGEFMYKGPSSDVCGNLPENVKFVNAECEKAKKAAVAKKAEAESEGKTDSSPKPAEGASSPEPKAGAETGGESHVGENSLDLSALFGLNNTHRYINLMEAEIKNNSLNLSGDSASGGTDGVSEKGKRYIKYMTEALSAKDQMITIAYKQYMGIFKSAFKKNQGAKIDGSSANVNNKNSEPKAKATATTDTKKETTPAK